MYLLIAAALLFKFIHDFLDKFYTRHIGPGPQPGHRHPDNIRRKRKEVVESATTGDIYGMDFADPSTLVRKTGDSYFIQSLKVPEKMQEMKKELTEQFPNAEWVTPDTLVIKD